jgi:large subunit ribosomal protein L9
VRIRVVFLQDVLPKHLAGDTKEVSGGYARNYLIPMGLAAPAIGDPLQRIVKIRRAAEQRRARETQDMEQLAGLMEGTTVTIKARAGEGGRLYGSVTGTRIAEELSLVLGREIDRRTVGLTEPIKEIGSFEVPIHLYTNIAPSISVVVETEGGMTLRDAPEEVEETLASSEEEALESEDDSGEPEAEEADVRGEASAS